MKKLAFRAPGCYAQIPFGEAASIFTVLPGAMTQRGSGVEDAGGKSFQAREAWRPE